MILFYEKSIKDEVTKPTHHFPEADNNYMYGYDKTKKCTSILNLKFNNMYEYTLSIFATELIMNDKKYSNIGYTLMVDVECPVYLEPLHRDLPLIRKI